MDVAPFVLGHRLLAAPLLTVGSRGLIKPRVGVSGPPSAKMHQGAVQAPLDGEGVEPFLNADQIADHG